MSSPNTRIFCKARGNIVSKANRPRINMIPDKKETTKCPVEQQPSGTLTLLDE